jgi:hypothetical protein
MAVEALRVVRRMLLLVVVVVPWVTKPVAQPHQEHREQQHAAQPAPQRAPRSHPQQTGWAALLPPSSSSRVGPSAAMASPAWLPVHSIDSRFPPLSSVLQNVNRTVQQLCDLERLRPFGSVAELQGPPVHAPESPSRTLRLTSAVRCECRGTSDFTPSQQPSDKPAATGAIACNNVERLHPWRRHWQRLARRSCPPWAEPRRDRGLRRDKHAPYWLPRLAQQWRWQEWLGFLAEELRVDRQRGEPSHQ